jgi:hypothetical protein
MTAMDKRCPIQTVALDYNVLKSTLRSHVMGITLSRKRGKIQSYQQLRKRKWYSIFMVAMYGHPISLTELEIKVAEATQLRDTPFKDGIPGPS